MADTISRYLLIVALSSAFGVAYFTWLRSSVDKILTKKKHSSHIHVSFALRMLFAIVFFHIMLAYFPGIWEAAAMLVSFIAVRYTMIRIERAR